MEENIVDQIKTLLVNKSYELFKDSELLQKRLAKEEINLFEEKISICSEYFDKKYFDEDKFEHGIRTLFVEFPIDEIEDEATTYRKLYVYNRALVDFIHEIDGTY